MVRDILLTNMVNELVTMDAILGSAVTHVRLELSKNRTSFAGHAARCARGCPSLAPEKPRKCIVVFGVLVLAAHLRGLEVSTSIQTGS